MAFTTRESVLLRIRRGESVGWNEFYSIYGPLILLRGRDRGVSASESDDLVQNVMTSVFQGKKVAQFDRSRGRFRDFLKTIIDRRAIDLLRKRRPYEVSMDSLKDSGFQPESGDRKYLEARWETAWQKHLVGQAMEELEPQVKQTTFDAFIGTVFDGRSPEEVSNDLGLTVQNVYAIKHRLLKQLREIVLELEDAE